MVEPGNAAKSALAINADANSGSTRLRVRAELPDTRFGVHVLLRALGNTELEVPLQLSLSWRAEHGKWPGLLRARPFPFRGSECGPIRSMYVSRRKLNRRS